MTDIVERLRCWVIATDAVPASDLMDEAADEIERLQRSITDWKLEADVHRKRAAAAVAEIERLRLTDAERQAIEWCIEQWAGINRSTTLRNLLERLK